MTEKEAFKIGFQIKAAQLGVEPEQLLTKTAFNPLNLLPFGESLSSLAGTALSTIGPLALAAPPALGIAGGLTLANMQDKPLPTDEAQQMEQLEELRRATNQIVAAKRARKHLAVTP